MKKYAIAPEGCEEYLTPGKLYEIEEEDKSTFKSTFCIISDTGMVLLCLKRGCKHLNGQDWKIIEEEE
jgi:hypothetical protein